MLLTCAARFDVTIILEFFVIWVKVNKAIFLRYNVATESQRQELFFFLKEQEGAMFPSLINIIIASSMIDRSLVSTSSYGRTTNVNPFKFKYSHVL